MLILSNRFSPLRGFIATIVTTALALPVLAPATAVAAVDELITTTARGRAEAVQDVPATIAVIGEDAIDGYGVQRVEDFVNLVPGVTMVNAAEVGDTQINIRGINGARDAENSIALVIDGILMTNPAAVNREYTNLQQIEVMKGPQGAIYGRNAAAGAFIITTQMPGDELGFNIRGSVAEDESYNLIGNLNGPIGNSLGYNIGFDYRTTDGFYQNKKCTTTGGCGDSSNIVTEDGVTDSFESWNVDGRLVWDVTDSWMLDGKFRYGEVDANSITFNSVFHLPGAAAFLGFPEFNEDVNDHPFGFNTNVISTNDQEATELSLRSVNELSFGELTIWGLYSNIENNLGADGTSGAFGFFFTDPNCIASTGAAQGFPVNPPQIIGPDPANSIFGAYTPTTCDGTQFQVRNQEDISLEIRLASNADQRLRWSAGLYYLNIDREVGVNTGVDTGDGIIPQLYVPNGGVTGVSNATDQLIWDQFDTDVYAVFGSLDYDITDNLTAGLALRYDKEEREAKSLVPTAAQGATSQYINCGLGNPAFTDPINPGLCPDVNPSGEFTPRSADFSETQPKATLTWDIYPTLTAFASYGVGFKSGGFNNQGSEATVDKWINSVPGITSGAFTPVGIKDDYKKETSGSAELGIKSSIGDSLRWEGSIYRVDVDDMQFFEFLVGPFGLLRVVENIDEVDIIGIELSGTWSPTEWLNLFLGGNWIDSEIKSNSVRPDTVGNKSPYTPDWTLNGGGDWTVPMTSSLNFIGSLDFTGVGETWFHAVQAQERPTGLAAFFIPGDYTITQRDTYWLWNARVGIGGDNWSAVIFGRNIGDEEWLQEVIPAPEFGGSFTHPGTLSRWGIEATYRF